MKYTNTYLGTYLCCLCSRGMYVPITSIWNRILSKEHRSCHMIASNRSNFPQNTVFKTLKNSAITVSSRLLCQLDNHFIPQRSPVCLNKSPKTTVEFQRPFFPDFRRLYKNKDVAHSKQPLYIYISETYYNCTKFDLLIHTAASNTIMPSASVYEISKIRAQVIVFFHRFQNSQKHQCNSYAIYFVHIFWREISYARNPFYSLETRAQDWGGSR